MKNPTKPTTRKLAVAARAVARKPAPKRNVAICSGGGGAYGSPPDSPKCTAKRLGTKPGTGLLCAKHLAIWKVEAKARRAAAAPKSKATKANRSNVVKVPAARKSARAHERVAHSRVPKQERIAAFVGPVDSN